LKALGPDWLAGRFTKAALHTHDAGIKALEVLRQAFAKFHDTGPVGWATTSGFDGENALREQQDAVGIVADFLSRVESTGQ